MNILFLILKVVVPVGEQIALHFIHSQDGQHTLSTVSGTIDEVSPILEGVLAGLAAKK